MDSYIGIEKKMENVEGLITKTSPHIRDRFRSRLVLERNLQSNPEKVTKEEHKELIDETFSIFMPIIKEIYSRDFYIDRPALRWILIGLITPVILLGIAMQTKIMIVLWLALGVFVVSGFLSLFFMLTSNDRYFYKEVLPKFAKCLAVVHPTLNELNEILDAYWEAGIEITKKISSEDLMQQIASHVCSKTGAW